MKWTNYRKLVSHLNTIHPSAFDYINSGGGENGCLACHCKALDEGCDLQRANANNQSIVHFLGVSLVEAMYLFGSSAKYFPSVADIDPTALQWDDPSIRIAELGISEALRRLAVVAARHGGEPTETQAQPFTGDESAFLAAVRAIAAHPERVE